VVLFFVTHLLDIPQLEDLQIIKFAEIAPFLCIFGVIIQEGYTELS
jgi:hypothetical protein